MFKKQLFKAEIIVSEKDYFKIKKIAQKWNKRKNLYIDGTKEEIFIIKLQEDHRTLKRLKADLEIAQLFEAEFEMKIIL